jgi:hypothetical protein
VPDTIKVYYQPPSGCEFIVSTENGKTTTTGVSCLDGFMNLTNFMFKTASHSTEISDGCADVPYSLESYLTARFPSDVVVSRDGKKLPEPYFVSYPGYTDMKDQSVAMGGSGGVIQIKLDNAIIVQKTRTNTFDTLDSEPAFNTNDPLLSITESMREACTKLEDTVSQQFIIPHNYYLNVSGNTIYLMKLSQSPFDITDKNDASWTAIYYFDTSTLSKYCTLVVSGVKLNDKYYTKATGNSAVVEIDGTCHYDDCSSADGCQCWNQSDHPDDDMDYCKDCKALYPNSNIFDMTTKLVIK